LADQNAEQDIPSQAEIGGKDWWERLVGKIGGKDWWERLVGKIGGKDWWERLAAESDRKFLPWMPDRIPSKIGNTLTHNVIRTTQSPQMIVIFFQVNYHLLSLQYRNMVISASSILSDLCRQLVARFETGVTRR
jgi:hypothetical protein